MRCIIVLLCCSTALPFAAPANAQNTTPATKVPADRSQAGTGLEDIVVTARRSEERLQDVPVAVSAVSAAGLERLGITRAQDLQIAVPSLQISSPYGDSQPNFTLRGIGPANQYQINTASPIGLYIDEVYQAFRPTQGLQMFDLDRVEVVKGPQGTLFGRNTTAGAISMFSRQPKLTDEKDGYVSIGYGNFNRYQIEAATDLTMVDDRLGMRVAISREDGDGSIRNVGKGPDFRSVNSLAMRATIRARPTDRLNISVTGSYSRDNPIPTPIFAVGLGPGETNPDGYSRAALGPFEAESNDALRFLARNASGTARVAWDLAPVKITSVTSYGESIQRQRTDCDGSPFSLCYFRANIDAKEFSQDLRANYSGGPVKLVTGLYYGMDQIVSRDSGAGFFVETGGPNYSYNYKQTRKSYAVYGELTFSVTDRLNLSLGGRVTHDSNTLAGYQNFLLSGRGGVPVAVTVPSSPVFDPSLTVPTQKHGETYAPWRAILDYKFAPDVMAYASYSRGYRSGNYNAQAFNSEAELVYIGPEEADNYEVGLKSTFLDRRLRLNAAAFLTDYRNQQVLDTVGGFLNSLIGLNGRIKGFEIEAQAAVTDRLTLNANFGLLRSRYKQGFVNAGYSVRGHEFPFAPRETLQTGVVWKAIKSATGTLTLSGNASYTGRYQYLPEGSQALVATSMFRGGSDPYWLFDGRISYTVGRFELAVWGKNLSNKVYFPYYVNSEGLGLDYGVIGTPRTFGGRVKVSF